MAQRARPGVSGVAPPVKAAKTSTAAPAPNTVSALRATPGASAAVTGSRFFTSSPGRANTSTSVSTAAVKPRRRCSLRRAASISGSSSDAAPSASRNGSSHTSAYRSVSQPTPATAAHQIS